MNVIILAAGQGKRLRPLTDNRPKCMVELFGKTLLEWQLKVFKELGIDDICVVTGYNSELINFENIKYVKNENYEKSNMLESLFCARDFFSDNTIVSYGDIIFERKVLERLINSEEDFSVIIDKNWKEYWSLRFDDPIQDLESLELDSEQNITSIGKKIDDINDINGQYIGLMKFQNKAIDIIKKFYYETKKNSVNNKNPLNPSVSFENSYMTDFLQGLINNGNKLKALDITNGWLELDNINDYELYRKLFSEGNLNRFFRIN